MQYKQLSIELWQFDCLGFIEYQMSTPDQILIWATI